METKGIAELMKKLQSMHDDIDDDVDFILEMNAKEGVRIAQTNAKEVMNKGYWTGNLARQIEAVKVGDLHHRVISNAHYSGYLEFGTRYMSKAQFMFQTHQQLKKQVNKDLHRLLNG